LYIVRPGIREEPTHRIATHIYLGGSLLGVLLVLVKNWNVHAEFGCEALGKIPIVQGKDCQPVQFVPQPPFLILDDIENRDAAE